MATDVFSPKERLLRILNKKEAERPPVICPGGMMNAAVVDVMVKGTRLPEAHHDPVLMSSLAKEVAEKTGFENFGVPFCMTVEAEVLGSEINYGTLECEPKIQKEKYPSVGLVDRLPLGSMEKNTRVGAIVQAIYALSRSNPDIPAIGSLTGPLSTAASLVDPMTFLKELRKDKAHAHQVLEYVNAHLMEYAALMIDNGASLISIADPTATGEILGPNMFEEYAVPYLNRLADGIHKLGAPVIIHICGELKAVKPLAAGLQADALSVDAFVSLKKLKEEFKEVTTMGNLSTILLEQSGTESVQRAAELLLKNRIDILAPACGLSTSTPLENIRAFTDQVRAGK